MKKTILLILSGLLSIITLCGFAISYGALLTTAIDSGIDSIWGWFSTRYIWPLTVDFALLTFECGLFYCILFQPHLRRMMTSLVISFVMLTVFFNVIHGLPAVLPVTPTDWMKASESAIAWSLPPLVQCLGVLVLSKIFHGIVSGKEVTPVKKQEATPAPVEQEAPAPVEQKAPAPFIDIPVERKEVTNNIPVNVTPPAPEPAFAFRDDFEEEDNDDHLGVSLGDLIESSVGSRPKKNTKSGSAKDVMEMFKHTEDVGTIAKTLNLPTSKVRDIIASAYDAHTS